MARSVSLSLAFAAALAALLCIWSAECRPNEQQSAAAVRSALDEEAAALSDEDPLDERVGRSGTAEAADAAHRERLERLLERLQAVRERAFKRNRPQYSRSRCALKSCSCTIHDEYSNLRGIRESLDPPPKHMSKF